MKIISSMMDDIDWIPYPGVKTTGALFVTFKNGDCWQYDAVSISTYNDLMNAPSAGKYFSQHIKNGPYIAKKLDAKPSTQKQFEMLQVFGDVIKHLEAKGLCRREQDDQGDPRIVFNGDYTREIANFYTQGKISEEMKELKEDTKDLEEDFPGQNREYFHQKTIEAAVSLADRVILEASDGSVEETDYLTSEVAFKFVEKVNMARRSALSRKQLMENLNEKR